MDWSKLLMRDLKQHSVCLTAGLEFPLMDFLPHGGFGLVSISLNSHDPAGSSDVEIKHHWISQSENCSLCPTCLYTEES